jgi:hypothetical protein
MVFFLPPPNPLCPFFSEVFFSTYNFAPLLVLLPTSIYPSRNYPLIPGPRVGIQTNQHPSLLRRHPSDTLPDALSHLSLSTSLHTRSFHFHLLLTLTNHRNSVWLGNYLHMLSFLEIAFPLSCSDKYAGSSTSLNPFFYLIHIAIAQSSRAHV